MMNQEQRLITKREEWEELLAIFEVKENLFLDFQVSDGLRNCDVEVFRYVYYPENDAEEKPTAIIQWNIEIIKVHKILGIARIACGSREGNGFFHKELSIPEQQIYLQKSLRETIKRSKRGISLLLLPVYISIVSDCKRDILPHSLVEEIFSVELDLSPSVLELESNFDKKRRNGIRKAQKNGISTNIDRTKEGLSFFYDLKKSQYWSGDEKTIWTNRTKEAFGAYHQRATTVGKHLLFISKYQRNNVAFASVYSIDRKLFYKEGGLDKSFQEFRPLDRLLMDVIIWGKEHGYTSLDFCGANFDEDNNPDARTKFKLQFGAIPKRYYHYQKITLPFAGKRTPLLFTRLLTK